MDLHEIKKTISNNNSNKFFSTPPPSKEGMKNKIFFEHALRFFSL